MFKKLEMAREKGRKKKELTLVGFLVGDPKDLSILFAKMRAEWKPLQGNMTFSVLKRGWFEISFSNEEDLKLVWSNRPYHMFSQLLLIKHWYPGFDPTTESISKLHLWVRLHYLPEEFANAKALETIIEGNRIGKFLKMDPTHESERWNMFTHFCINTDIEKTFGKGVIVPDEHLNQIKFSLWFDDFSLGCGACGKLDHIYKNCHNKNGSIPMLQLKMKNPLPKKSHIPGSPSGSSASGEWNKVGKKNEVIKPSPQNIFSSSNIYLCEKGGVKITYETNDSDEVFDTGLMNEETYEKTPNLIAVADDIFNGKHGMKDGKPMDTNKKEAYKEQQHSMAGREDIIIPEMRLENKKGSPCSAGVQQVRNSEENLHEMVMSENEAVVGYMGKIDDRKGLSLVTNTANNQMLSMENEKVEEDEYYDEEHEEPFDYEHDDLIVDDMIELDIAEVPIPIFSEAEMGPILLSDDSPLTDKDLEDFINNDQEDPKGNNLNSETSFYSAHKPDHSSSSIAIKLENLGVTNENISNSTSSKRKVNEGIDDTASSDFKASKRTKN